MDGHLDGFINAGVQGKKKAKFESRRWELPGGHLSGDFFPCENELSIKEWS
jgi:hypothetical protein